MSDKVLERVILSLAFAIWNRTFTVSNGCATKVARIPAQVPEMKSISMSHIKRVSRVKGKTRVLVCSEHCW